jgi:hypothetical protein
MIKGGRGKLHPYERQEQGGYGMPCPYIGLVHEYPA